MNDPLQTLLAMGVVPTAQFPTNSRYYGSSTLTYTSPDGEMVSYVARRFVPQPGAANFSTIAQHTVRQGDRLDLIAAKYLGDPLMFWLICDANGSIRPGELTETPGVTIDITLPMGTPGVQGA